MLSEAGWMIRRLSVLLAWYQISQSQGDINFLTGFCANVTDMTGEI